jgi:hypothetical protein
MLGQNGTARIWDAATPRAGPGSLDLAIEQRAALERTQSPRGQHLDRCGTCYTPRCAKTNFDTMKYHAVTLRPDATISANIQLELGPL